MPTLCVTAEEAARHIHTDMTAKQFLRAVNRGEMPGPVINSRPQMWALSQIVKTLAGEQPIGAPSVQEDELMEIIRGLGKHEIR